MVHTQQLDNALSSDFTSLASRAWRILAWHDCMQARANLWVIPYKGAFDKY